MSNAATQEFRTSVPVRERSGERFVFYAGDIISSRSKQSNPNWRQGGIVHNHELLKHVGGYIPRCRITALRDHFHSEHTSFVDDLKKEAYVKTYTVFEGGVEKQVGMVKDKNGDIVHDGLLRKPIYPADHIEAVLGEGVVEIKAASRSEAFALNEFLMEGLESFPETIIELQRHFESKTFTATTEAQKEAADAAVRSCVDYVVAQGQILAEQKAHYENAKTKGKPYVFGGRAEMLFEQLGEQRPDRVAQAQAGQLNELTNNISRFVNAQLKANEPQNADASELERIKAENERLRAELEAKNAPKTEQVETDFSEQFCADKNGKGEDCKGKVTKEVNGEFYCSSHPKE